MLPRCGLLITTMDLMRRFVYIIKYPFSPMPLIGNTRIRGVSLPGGTIEDMVFNAFREYWRRIFESSDIDVHV